MEVAAVNDWFEVVFWIIFAATGIFVVWNIISILVESWRFNRWWNAAPPAGTPRSKSADDDAWHLSAMSSSDTSSVTLSSDVSSSSDSGSSDVSGGDSGGGYESGGGDFGGGGSSGGWND